MPPSPDKAALRSILLEQLAYLIDEVEAFRTAVHRVPDEVLAGHPLPADRSLKQMYGMLAVADAGCFLPALERMQAEDIPFLPPPDATLLAGFSWDDAPIGDILDRVVEARTRLVGFLRGLSPEAWDRTARLGERRHDVYTLAHFVTQHDADWLRAAGYRLHESRLTSRPA